MEQRVGQATVSGYACGHCYDTGIVTGSAELDGRRVVIHTICTYCPVAKSYCSQEIAATPIPIEGTGGGGGGIE